MPDGSMLERVPAWTMAALLALGLLTTLLVSSALGRRIARRGRTDELGTIETMASGLLGLLLAFNFSIAQNRFDARQAQLVREADAVGTAHLRCSVLDEEARRSCREGLHRYAMLRIEAYDAYARSDARAMSRALGEGERIQRDLWALVARAARAEPTPTNAILMSALNDVIDRDADRRASMRIVVPQAVTLAIMFACLAWAMIVGYASGIRESRPRGGWVVVAVLISVVFGVALDFDRPRSGLITTEAADRAMQMLVRSMEAPTAD